MAPDGLSDRDYAARIIARWQRDPRLFVREALGVTPERWQEEAWGRLADGQLRLAIRSGHGVGKTFFMGATALWFGATRSDAKIPCTAPSAHQLATQLWGEIAICRQRLYDRVPDMGSQIEVKSDEVAFRLSGSNAYARTARKETPEALQGFHAKNLLFLIDEASGIEEKIFEVAEGALSTPGALVVMAGNPTRTDGYFHRAHTSARDRWSTMTVACGESTRVDPGYIEGMAKDYGRTSNVYRVRVLGEFPAGSSDAVILLDLIEAAKFRDIRPGAMKPLWGVDVARFGDDATALAKRRGPALLEKVRTWHGKDTMQVAGLIAKEYDETPEDLKPAEVLVDVIGVGAGVVDRLKETGRVPVRGVNVAESPSIDEDKFWKLRDELWWRAREWFETRACSIPDDEALIGELAGPTYKVNSTGQIVVEAKSKMKERGLRSPDRADAFCLTFAGNASAAAWGGFRGKLDYAKINRGIR